MGTEDLIAARRRYREYVDLFDATPEHPYDEPYLMMDFNEWLEENWDFD